MIEDEEYVKLTFHGQSFMLHQIRKMVGLMLFINRFTASPNIILNAYGRRSFATPMAPGEFLMLDRIGYAGYNKKLASIGQAEQCNPILIEDVEERNVFKRDVLYPKILKEEKAESLVRKFISKIDHFIPVVDGVQLDLYQWIQDWAKLNLSSQPFTLGNQLGKLKPAEEPTTSTETTTTSITTTTTTTTNEDSTKTILESGATESKSIEEDQQQQQES
jgi:tRNA pseudouridine38-40 synthase